jgi:hypothetical protein
MNFGLMNSDTMFTNFNSPTLVNNSIKYNNNIQTNNQYRSFLTNNATQIINTNFENAYSSTPFNPNKYTGNKSELYMYQNIYDQSKPDGYIDSDLKKSYLSRQQLNTRKHNAQQLNQYQQLNNNK